ncbi:glycoside hydrolase family 19 protein [Lelliottia sp. V106_10]|uniref:glycoside hydrolase family 19 protein n=1 Tax=Lelliottia wanjuensis TaxID=3050585 RepID=UPI00254A8F6F|nr:MULTISPECIES: glycoside hydrolase family 19 protein [unclassified Lelliottia]MDK9354912.1 glycoside hydrolase family 19 protein [Lelliottia sp. V106_16]MDK9372120.1 glycoside hydrolase family 19 protein [Lelliottia sp. V106_10]MDK9598756.1 glycoside hydrolase family 19 protein [Lelliottia sp. V106_5]
MSRIHSRLKRYSFALPCLLAFPVITLAEEAPSASEPYIIKQSDLNKKEASLTQNPLMQEVKASIRTLDNDSVEKIAPGRTENPANVKRVEKILSRDQWDYIFPLRAPEYSYENFLKAIGKFPAVCGTYSDGRDSDAICRKGLATMFAHFAQETGGHESWRPEAEWRQGLVWLREMGWEEGQKGGYNGECNPDVWQGQTWPCGKDKDGDFVSYFGRGAKQLSYNYNYGPFSDAMFGTVRTLLDKPELVADTWLNLASAVFFYVTPQAPKPSMLHVIDGTWKPNAHDKENGLVPGFGVTIQIINGGVECGGPTEIAQGENRISYYKSEADYLKVPVAADEVLGCKNMKQFDEGGSGALPQYWEQDWGWDSTTPTGQTYSCQLVGYQTPFSAFKEGDYQRCVQHFFNVKIVDESGKEEPVTPTPTPEPAPTPAPGDTNIAPVAVLTGPIGEVEGQANVTLNAASSSDANGDKLSYAWLLPNGTTLEGTDRDSLSFVAPVVTVKKQYTFTLTVSDGKKSDVATYTLTVIPQVQPLPAPDTGKTCADSWDAGKIYYGGEEVNWKGKQYRANYWTQDNEPGNPDFTGEWSQWKEIKACK